MKTANMTWDEAVGYLDDFFMPNPKRDKCTVINSDFPDCELTAIGMWQGNIKGYVFLYTLIDEQWEECSPTPAMLASTNWRVK